MSKEFRLLKASLKSLKRVREACTAFEEVLDFAVSEESENGADISDNELCELHMALNNINREAEVCKLILRDSLYEYRKEEIHG
jgi:hypothetical protein